MSIRVGLVKTSLVFGLLAAVSACTSTDSTLGVETTTTPQAVTVDTSTTPLPPPASPTDDPATTALADTSSNVGTQVAAVTPATVSSTVYFAPIVGAPVSKVTALSGRLSSAAATNGVALRGSNRSGINHEIRGYFSALSEGGNTTVIHVWDVFTPQGQRVHRIQGQEKVQGVATDPWSAVPNAAMERIADSVLSQYSAWRSSS